MNTGIDALVSYAHRHPRAITLAALTAVVTPLVVDNYRKFLGLGKSGLSPYGPLGWFVATTLTGFGRETVSTTEYERDANQERWLKVTVERRGVRPVTGWHCVPHRQLDRLPTEVIAKRLEALFEKHATANPTLVEVVPSPHEKLDPGMVIHPDIPSPHKEADQAWREIAHIHAADHSLHVVLSPADCKTAIDLGWAERHPLSGVSRIFPLSSGYLLVYAPRDEEELDVVERIIVASIGYMTGSRSVA
ncbi:hypothetical protein DFH07DRAFT_852051 [Mycena maculata]|uniref:Luciferase domain-containing protein n=1 Tax=Mycena maculata TaxID=230809 RepID=A0AAD7HU10_9AGAR|nr:hypothetical protein DFH07DRAFT_852051 [Mycena maculata]